jgi:hypothetical protein
MKGMSACPGQASLQEFLLGRIPDETAAAIETHLSGRFVCRPLAEFPLL